MRSMICLVGAMALIACGDDETDLSDGDLDGGQPDSSLDAARPDAGDADTRDSNLLPECYSLKTSYKLYLEGGLAPLRDVYTLSATGEVKLERLPGGAYMDAGTFSCAGAIGLCEGPALDVADFRVFDLALSASFGDGATVYGEDTRPYDGSVLVIERGSDGKKILVGDECEADAGCTAIPAQVAVAKQLFARLLNEVPLGKQADGGSCGQ